MTPEETSVLVARAANGDRAAWNAIVAEYSLLLLSVVRRFRLQDAQAADAIQTVWLRLVENIHRIRDTTRLASWLKVTAERVCIDLIRASTRVVLVDEYDEGVTRTTPIYGVAHRDPEVAALQHERERLVRRALMRLPARHRELLTLLVADPPVRYEEISAQLGIPVGSIGPTRARVLQRLAAELKTMDFHDLALD